MIKKQKYVLFFLTIFSFLFISRSYCDGLLTNSSAKEFIESFIKHYEFSAEGRYAHEYHPALLSKTAYSLDGLEESLAKNGFNLSGRIVICGYEEHAFPSYFADGIDSEIDDEASSKSRVGWSLQLHNYFGFMTGFLFKDFNFFSEHWFAGNSVFEHIDSDDIEIFDDKAEIFQEHAFGQGLNLLRAAQDSVIRKFNKQDFKGIFEELIKFWGCMYRGEIKVGNKQSAGTQDILFSIEYAKHLVRSNLSLFNFYMGPDITYPIEVSSCQGQEATLHAQNFVQTFSNRLKVINNKPTVYVFCSFVDGVGKSTMLGNIKNYRKHGKNVEKYERVDNSSSQLADLFKLDENIFIADLPAQVSHFTYKPDGFVYVGVERELTKDCVGKVQKYVRENQQILKNNYDRLLLQIKGEIDLHGYFAQELNDVMQPEKAFIRNLFLTKKEKNNNWMPFSFEGKNYLFNSDNIFQIRILVPLGLVQSEGLKNIETEQMLFFAGIKFPAPYQYFLNNFLEKLKSNGIENVVFVDFISMYPRSSRENIRLNYLLQQMSLLDSEFDLKHSLYRDFVSGSQLLFLLRQYSAFSKISQAFKLEVLTRFALFKILLEMDKQDLKAVAVDELTVLIKKEFDRVEKEDISFLDDFSKKKLKSETEKLESAFGLTKNFVNIQQFSFADAVLFSFHLSEFFNKSVDSEQLNALWQSVGKISQIGKNVLNFSQDEVAITNQGIRVRSLYCFDPECKDERLLAPFLRTLRCCWYAAISNIFNAKELDNNIFSVAQPRFFAPSLFLDFGLDGKIYLFQRLFDEWQEEVPLKMKHYATIFNLSNLEKVRWGVFENMPYLLDWKSLATNKGIFEFDCDSCAKSFQGQMKTIATFLLQKYQKDLGPDKVVTASQFYKKLSESMLWKSEWNNMLRTAKENSTAQNNKKDTKNIKKDKKELDDKNKNKKNEKVKKQIKIFLGKAEQVAAARLLIRFLATLEMLVKDPESEIIIRRGNREDFAAAIKLFEKVTLPKYFGILFKDDLFENYDFVEPYPSWEEWDLVKEKE